MKLKENELILITGGAITGTLINAVVRLINSVIDIGKMVGSTIRRIVSNKNYC